MKVSESRRSARLADQIMRETATLLLTEVQDPRLELVTVSGARLNADMSIVMVFYTVSGDEARRKEVQEALERAAPFLRGQVGRALKLRRAPEMRFKFDEFLEGMVYGHSE